MYVQTATRIVCTLVLEQSIACCFCQILCKSHDVEFQATPNNWILLLNFIQYRNLFPGLTCILNAFMSRNPNCKKGDYTYRLLITATYLKFRLTTNQNKITVHLKLRKSDYKITVFHLYYLSLVLYTSLINSVHISTLYSPSIVNYKYYR